MADVFLSYSSKDRATAARVEQALSDAGFAVFWDQEVPVGRDWNQWIGDKLAQSRVAVVLWSKASVASRNVVHEATIAMERGKLIPVVIESLRAEEFPMGFYTVQAADLRSDHGMAQLVGAVRTRLGEGVGGPRPERRASPPWFALIGGGAAALALAIGVTWAIVGRGPAEAPRPVPEAPVEVVKAAPMSAPERLVGRWRWQGVACAEGPRVALDQGDIVVSMLGVDTYRHVIEQVERDAVHTVVLAPEAARGEQYVLTRSGDRLIVRAVASGNEDVWEACS